MFVSLAVDGAGLGAMLCGGTMAAGDLLLWSRRSESCVLFTSSWSCRGHQYGVAHSVSCHSLFHPRNVRCVGVHWTRGHDEDCTGLGDTMKTALDPGTRWSLSGRLSFRRETIEASAASRASFLSNSARALELAIPLVGRRAWSAARAMTGVH
jgi:hypothetical protein